MDARIPLGYAVAQPEIHTPLDATRKAQSLRQMIQQSTLNDQRIAEEQSQARARDEDRADDDEIQRAFVQYGGDHEKMRAAIAPKVKLRNLQRWDADHLKQQQAATALANEKRLELATTNQLVGSTAAGLLQLPYEQRKAALPSALKRLQDSHIDVSQYAGMDPTDDALRYAIAISNYTGTVLSNAEKQAETEREKATKARAEEQTRIAQEKEVEEQKGRMRQQAARTHLTVSTPEQHAAWFAALPKEVAAEYANLKEYSPATRRTVQQMALEAKERFADEDRDAAQAGRNALQRYREDALNLRESIANQTNALREAKLEIDRIRAERGGGAGGGRTLTPNALKTEEREIERLERGTSTQPGLHAKRMQLGRQLREGKNDKGEDLNPNGRSRIETELAAVDDNLQQVQFRKARLYSIATPALDAVKAAQEGTEIEADGAIWKKKGGVAFFERLVGQEPAPTQQPAHGASGQQQPAAQPKAQQQPPSAAPKTRAQVATAAATHQRPAIKPPSKPGEKWNERDARAYAIQLGKDPDWYVDELRSLKLIQ